LIRKSPKSSPGLAGEILTYSPFASTRGLSSNDSLPSARPFTTSGVTRLGHCAKTTASGSDRRRPRITWRKRTTPRARKIAPDYRPRIPIQAVMEAVLDGNGSITCLYRKLDSAIMVMKSAEDRRRYDVAQVLDSPMDRSLLVERPMCPQFVIIGGLAPEKYN
jgi:hypothetical protein